ncbi:hypothetical protein FUT88_13390 [Ralstonia sp. TCR112]|uniref:hypothetical protein n=1 Tax=Ralstonia sp. TCR112 TaxID=2601730 RepID=UPI0011BF0619|nr:hypothetical protein [Ralstonia sp. TCR112]TXD58865.1 hypothetical protein FUT88_13390 [Ralstonia sp. TCR112]
MADLTDVSSALVLLIDGVLYPNGDAQSPASGVPATRIYPGWPVPGQLDADLAAGIANVSVFNRPEARNTTRYQTVPQDMTVTAPTLTLTINGRTVTVGGTVAAGVNTAVIVGTSAFTYQTVANDTLSTIAAALASQINAAYPGTTSSGAVITLPNTGPPINAARVGGSGQQMTEAGRVEQVFQITVWANTPDNRKAIAKLITPAIMATRFLTLADGTAARVILKGQRDDDVPQKELLFRRDIMVTVEYVETVVNTSTTVVDIVQNTAVGVNGYNGGTYPNTTTTNV